MKRNFIGYGDEKPKLSWPDKNHLAVSIVVNIEEGAELSISSGDKENEYIYENNHEEYAASYYSISNFLSKFYVE